MLCKKLLCATLLFSSMAIRTETSYDQRETTFLCSGILTQICGVYNTAARSVLRMPLGILLIAAGTSEILFYKKIIAKADSMDTRISEKLRNKLEQMKADAAKKASEILENDAEEK